MIEFTCNTCGARGRDRYTSGVRPGDDWAPACDWCGFPAEVSQEQLAAALAF